LKCAHEFNALNEIPEALKAEPEGFYAGFAITLAPKKASEHGNLPDRLAQGGRFLGRLFLRQNVDRQRPV